MNTLGFRNRKLFTQQTLRSNVYDPTRFPYSERFQVKDERELEGQEAISEDEEDGDELDFNASSVMISNIHRRPLRSVPTPFSSGSESSPSPPPTTRGSTINESEFSLDSIDSLSKLIEFHEPIIQALRDVRTTESQALQSRKIVIDFRRSAIQKQNPTISNPRPRTTTSDTNWQDDMDLEEHDLLGKQQLPFDRMLYLLDRYSDYCSLIGLSPFPVHHLKVAIWIQGDVVSLKTRIIPLRKSVRCYITSLVKIASLTGGDEMMLMKSQVLRDILQQLPVTRSSSVNRSLFNKTGERVDDRRLSHVDDNNHVGDSDSGDLIHQFDGTDDRGSIVAALRSQSGDSQSEDAFNIVREARRRAQSQNKSNVPIIRSKPKPDPHLHTLSRYATWMKSAGIPIWPIEPVRVSVWLRESVLSLVDGSHADLNFKVSLRTVQVYLSRLEYARSRTEVLFKDRFDNLATGSLYRHQAIIEILESFGSHTNNLSRTTTFASPSRRPSSHSHLISSPSVSRRGSFVSQSSTSVTSFDKSRHEGYGSSTIGEEDMECVMAWNSAAISQRGRRFSAVSVQDSLREEDEEKDEVHGRMKRMRSDDNFSFEPVRRQRMMDDDEKKEKGVKLDKGRISYILCNNLGEVKGEKDQADDNHRSNVHSSESGPVGAHHSNDSWTVSPLKICRSQLQHRLSLRGVDPPKCLIPSFDQFVLSSSSEC